VYPIVSSSLPFHGVAFLALAKQVDGIKVVIVDLDQSTFATASFSDLGIILNDVRFTPRRADFTEPEHPNGAGFKR
jgi:hypothetical protein